MAKKYVQTAMQSWFRGTGKERIEMLKIIIEIPAVYEQEFQENRFESTLRRLATDAHSIAGRYEKETAYMLVNAFKRATIVQQSG